MFAFGTQPTNSTPQDGGFSFGAATGKRTANANRTPQSFTTSTPEPFTNTSSREQRSEGIVTFRSQSRGSFRYRITMKEERVSFWLEDIKTKNQWESVALSMEDIVSTGSAIPQATLPDYVTCFQGCLQEATGAKESVCDLVAHESDGWSMIFTLQIRVFTTVWTPKYTITLKRIPLEPLDVLAAKVRDQEDAITSLKQQVATLSAKVNTKPQSLGFASAKMNKSFTANQTLILEQDTRSSVNVVEFKASGAIMFLVPGVYAVHIMVKNNNANNSTTFDLLQGTKVFASCIDSNGHGHVQSSPMSQIINVTAGDEFSLVYRGNNNTNYASIIIQQLQ